MKRSKQTASLYSLTEFAYLLLFIFIGASAILFVRYVKSEETVASLKKETAFLQKMLDEKKDGAVPCWKRPDAKIPKIAGKVIIHSIFFFTVQNHAKTGMDTAESGLKKTILQSFKEDMAYAHKRKCYIRVKIINKTNDYSLYKKVAEKVKALDIVVVNE